VKLFRGKKPEIKGEIRYFGLADWWLEAFTEEERKYIEKTYKPMGAGGDYSLIKGNISFSSASVGTFLSGLSTWFARTEKDRNIARRILGKSLEVVDPKNDILGLHFTYSTLIEAWYRDRDSLPNALDEAIKACQGQIAIAPKAARAFKKEYPESPLPSHVGFTQLTIIYDKQGRHAEAIQVAQQAKQQGWVGDWDKRIERYQKKLNKKKQP
jgi:tetratricopeptide (TPR) repeat protein